MGNLKISVVWWGILAAAIGSQSQSWAASVWVEVGEAPKSSLALTLRAIQSARRTLRINSYEMTSPVISAAILNRIQAGVKVDVLAEGEPVGGFPSDGVPVRNALISGLNRARQGSYREMEGRKAGVRRFVYDHAKYMVVDDTSVLVGSENYGPTGHPSPGDLGNRGWEVLVHDPALAADFITIFNGDRGSNNRDIHQYIGFRKNESFFIQSPTGETYTGEVDPQVASPQKTVYVEVLPASRVMPVASPDTSLSTLIALIRSARRTLDIQQLSFYSDWDKQTNASPLLAEVIAAARRGVTVRVLLNDDAAFGRDPADSKNVTTANTLNQYARAYRLRLQAKIANLKGMGVTYIHNKGVLVDGAYTLVSSINWGQNSVENNRETGVVLASPQINAHYQELFNFDWSK